jgi:hypothetical protein
MQSQNQQPMLRDDFSEVSEDVSVRIFVLRNDMAIWGKLDTSTLAIYNTAQNGVTEVNIFDGTVTYTPDPNFFGVDNFRYQVCDNLGNCAQASVNVKIHPVNDAPMAVNDQDTMAEDSKIHIDVMANDTDMADQMTMDSHNLMLVQQPKHGHATLDGRLISYEPNNNYFGADAFYYAICDEGLCDSAFVRINVLPVNDKPVANNDYDSTYQGLLLVMDPLSNDFDTIDFAELDHQTLSTAGLRQPRHGFTFIDTSVALLLYIPIDDYVGLDTFQYLVCDYGPETILCDTAQIIINIEKPPEVATLQSSIPINVSYKIGRNAIPSATLPEILGKNTPANLYQMFSQYLSGTKALVPGRYHFEVNKHGTFVIK